MIRPSEPDVIAAVGDAFMAADELAGADVVRADVDSTEFVTAPVLARIAVLARLGAHYAVIARPARQAELVEVSHQVAEAFDHRRGRWLPAPPPREPARCDHCHERLTTSVETVESVETPGQKTTPFQQGVESRGVAA